ncbi:flagellar basal body P-ring formation protein FlgA [Candidatus Aerophobetes bacterium]|nr:flagellar basal body P-ring formation protein FlgA [Candidatus Aerophobetes bacterium]
MFLLSLGMTLLLINCGVGWGKIRAKICLKRFATVEKNYIELEEIAYLEGDEELIQRLKKIKIAPSPAPGNSRTINQEYIQVRLRQNKINQEEVFFEGEKEVKITSRSKLINGEEIVKVVKEKISLFLRGKEEEFQIEVDRIPPPLLLPFGEIKLKTEIPSLSYLYGPVVIPVKIYVNESIYRTIPISLKVKFFKEVLVTSKRIPPNYIFKKEDLHREKREITSPLIEPIINLSEIVGKRAIKSIPSSTILEKNMISSPFLIKKGDIITIFKEEGNIEVSTKGKALENGEKGSLIRVLNINSQKELQGIVISTHTVKVG